MHLRCGAFEQPAAAAGKQRVAAEEQRSSVDLGVVVGDVAGGVARHVDDFEAQPEPFGRVAIGKRDVRLRNVLARRAEDRALQKRSEALEASDVIAMVMGY